MNKLSKLVILILSISLFSCLGIFIYAGGDDNTSGFAWSENIGWVSFNSISDGSIIDYGVSVSLSTGDLSGHAWSEHIGWISFNRSETGDPPEQPYKGGSGAIAKYDFDTGELTGWFRVLANDGDWDGWVRFCDSSISKCSGFEARIDNSGDWHGWAWSDKVVGWLSFNSADPGAGGGSDYRVHSVLNNPPTVDSLTDTPPADYCNGNTPNNIFLGWQFNDTDPGDSQSAYQIEVTRLSDSTTATGSKVSSTAALIPVQQVNSDLANLGYGSNFIWYDPSESGYTWRVKVWDLKDAESSWSSSDSFNTTKHQWPSVDFSWSPQEPSQEEDVLFADQSTVYDGAAKSAWSWAFEDGNPASSDEQNPTIQFTSTGDHQVTLQVTDSDGFSCQTSKTVGAQIKLPGWKEILPW